MGNSFHFSRWQNVFFLTNLIDKQVEKSGKDSLLKLWKLGWGVLIEDRKLHFEIFLWSSIWQLLSWGWLFFCVPFIMVWLTWIIEYDTILTSFGQAIFFFPSVCEMLHKQMKNTQGFYEVETFNSMMKMDRTINEMDENVWNGCSARRNPKYKILQFLDLVQICKFAAEMRRTQSACPCLQDSSSPRTWKIVCMASNHTPNQGSRNCGASSQADFIQNNFLW